MSPEAERSCWSRPGWFALFGLGLLLRACAVPLLGMLDMQSYFEWGRRANEMGLAQGYTGIYYPAQWQIFQLDAWIAGLFGGSGIAYVCSFKLTTLLFDVGIFLVLLRILRLWNASPGYALLYWLHPWFVAVSFLGYVDPQYALLALGAALLAERARTTGEFLVAGLPLGVAFVMKPQAMVLVVAVAMGVALCGLRRRNWRPAGLLASSCVLFAAYSLFFLAGGASLFTVAGSYYSIANVMPALSADMLNAWYPLAYLLASGQPVHSVRDTFAVAGLFPVRHVTFALALACLALLPLLARRERRVGGDGGNWIVLFAWASMVPPMLVTNAHENHLYLASVFLVPLLARVGSGWARISIHVLLALQFVHIVALYGLGQNVLSRGLVWLQRIWIGPLAVLGAVLGVVGFLFLMQTLIGLVSNRESRFRPWMASAAVAAVLCAVYAAVLFGR